MRRKTSAKPSVNQKNNERKEKTGKTIPDDFLAILDNYFRTRQKLFFWIFFALSILFSLLLFDLRVSVGGDDSEYIIKADNFLKNFTYPSFQGPLYPILLSPFIAIFGIHLPLLKFLSFIFLTGHLFFFYKAFKNNIPPLLLVSSLLLISINAYLLFYGSQTYTEAFLLLAQSLFFLYFFRNFITIEPGSSELKKEIPKYLVLSLIILSLGLIKSIGFATIIVVFVYFLFEKKWKAAGLSVTGFAIVFGFWQFLKFLIWHENKAQFSDQASSLLLKHPYDPSQGTETLGGFIQRFVDNSNIYISRQFFKILGIRPELVNINGNIGVPEIIPLLTILVYVLFIIGFIWTLKNNKYLKFTGIYMAVMLGVTFVMLQTIWEGHRLIITIFPLMVVFLLTGIYGVFKQKKLKLFQFIIPIALLVVFLGTFSRSTTKIKEHQKILNAHLRGKITAGFTPDWVHFINMSIWAAKNVPGDKVIASRKPGISFIYSNRRFFGIYKVESEDPDSLLNYLYENKVEYVIMASLRKNEAQKTGEIINTIQRYLYFIQTKYPEKIKLIHQMGGPDDEPSYLFRIE